LRRPRQLLAEILAVLVLAPWLCGFAVLEKRDSDIEAGNAALKAGKPDDALVQYDKAVKKLPADAGAHFNRGAALYALSRFEEAGQEFLRATDAKEAVLKESAFYNLGNALFKKDKFKEAVAAYTRALGLRPDDKPAKWNLEIALKKQREDEEKHKNDQKKDDQNKDKKDQDKKKQDKNQDQNKDQNKDKKDQDKKKQDEQNKKDQDKQKQDQKDAQKPQPQGGDDRQQAEAVLDNLERSAKDLEKERARVRAVRRAPPERDW
jgi:Ca-activated chloride channel homolog